MESAWEAGEACVEFLDDRVKRGGAYYYARVSQGREHRVFQPHYGVAYGSPVWLDLR